MREQPTEHTDKLIRRGANRLNRTVGLVSEQIALPEDANEVAFHGFAGHFGLRGLFGGQIRTALDSIHIYNPLIGTPHKFG